MKLETERLVLRPLKTTDAKNITEGINDLEISKWLLKVAYPYTLKDSQNWVKSNQKKWKAKKKDDYSFGIELKKEKRIIGGIGLHHVDLEQGTAEVGYWLARKHWQKGYGTEALKELVNFAFGELKLRRLEAGVFVGNPSSGKLLEKLGFKLEGTKIKARVCKADGRIKDEYMYGLLKEDYKN